MDQHRLIVEAATALASGLPLGTVESVADAILTSDAGALRAEISRRVAHHQQRDRALAFVEGWKRDAADVPSAVVAVALQTAALSEQQHRDAQTVELVWTGPDVAQNPFRRTEQAILQLLDSAQKRITLVSFAVYNIPNIATALVKAARRGVILTVIVETPDKLGRHIKRALEKVTLCSSDPLCSEHEVGGNDTLHAAACHACSFLPETSCERGNKYLDRAVLVPTLERNAAFFG